MKKLLTAFVAMGLIFSLQSCAGFNALVSDVYKNCPVKDFKPRPAGGFEIHIQCDSTARIVSKAFLESIKKQKEKDEAPLLD